jgi:lipoic acid synthetase
MGQGPLRVRWLGRVGYRDALALQHGLFRHSKEDHLLLLEHPDVYTLGVRAKREHVLVDPSGVGAEFVRVDRGGDVTYHGPGQLVGYPICSLPMGPKAVPQFVHAIESFVIDVVRDLGLHDVGRVDAYPGVWVDPLGARPRKLCAIGIRVSRGRTMHGFALNIDPNMSMFDNIVPCGIQEYPVTSLRKEGLNVTMFDVVDAFCERATSALAFGPWTPERMMERQGISFAQSLVVGAPLSKERPLVRRLLAAGVNPSDGFDIAQRKPSWLRAEAKMGEEYLGLRRTMRRLNLVTVCEEAGCPNIYECWNDGTATFMINGERCTRACGFCLVDTRRPEPIDPNEPQRVAEAVARMNLAHVVVTAVARDDLTDGGASGFANTIKAIRTIRPM